MLMDLTAAPGLIGKNVVWREEPTMNSESQVKKLRAAYHSLRQQRDFLWQRMGQNHTMMDPRPFTDLLAELNSLGADFPDLVPALDVSRTELESLYGGTVHRSDVVIPHLDRVLARIEVELDDLPSETILQKREFTFVGDPELRRVLERDYLEVQKALVASCWKATIILCGGIIEAVLLHRLLMDPSSAKAASSSPRQNDLTRWSLDSLIEVAIELKHISPAAEKLSHSIREYRNLVHPGRELREKLSVAPEEARIAIEVVHILHRDLGK